MREQAEIQAGRPGSLKVARVSLALQAAEVLREHLRKGTWAGRLPSERALTWELGVSRSTLRQALDLLRREGVLQTVSRRDTRPVPGQAAARARPSQTILFLTTIPWDRFPYFELSFLHQLRCHVYLQGYGLMDHMRDPEMGRGMARSLQSLVVNTHPGGCILHHSSPAMQRWFQESGVPTLVCGRRYEDIRLPMIALNERAVVRHAAGLLLGRGCRRPALLWPDGEEPEKEPAVSGFREAIARHQGGSSALRPLIARHQRTPEGVEQAVGALLASGDRPDAFIVSDPRPALLLLAKLREEKLRLPQDVSLLCTTYSLFLDYVRPSLAHYVFHPVALAKKVARAAVRLARAEPMDRQSLLVNGRFVDGETLRPAPAAAKEERAGKGREGKDSDR